MWLFSNQTPDTLPPSDEEDLEEGECSQTSMHSEPETLTQGGFQEKRDSTELNLIDQRNDSKFNEYFDQRMGDWNRVKQLEKELAKNKRRLEELKNRGMLVMNNSQSDLTIYTKAVEKQRDSSSSEELEDIIDTSDELLNPIEITEKQLTTTKDQMSRDENPRETQKQSKGGNERDKSAAEQHAEWVIQEAEGSRLRVAKAKGNDQEIESKLRQIRMSQEFRKTHLQLVPVKGMVDDNYMLVASHVEEAIRVKILNNEYVDFAKLLRRDKPYGQEED